MENTIRRTDSLISLCIDYIAKNLSKYMIDKNAFQYLPPNLRNCLLKKFLSSSFFWTKVDFSDALSMLIYPLMHCIDLSLVNVTDEVLNLLKDCQNLKAVYLTRVKNHDVSSQALIKFITPLKDLFMLQLSNCSGVNDEVMINISNNCQRLAGLDVGGCGKVTDLGAVAISCLEDLQWVTLSGTQVSNRGIEKLVGGTSGRKLKELRISNCSNVSTGIVLLQKIIQCCPNIEVLVFYNMQQKEDMNDAFALPISEGSMKNLKQLTWTVHW